MKIHLFVSNRNEQYDPNRKVSTRVINIQPLPAEVTPGLKPGEAPVAGENPNAAVFESAQAQVSVNLVGVTAEVFDLLKPGTRLTLTEEA